MVWEIPKPLPLEYKFRISRECSIPKKQNQKTIMKRLLFLLGVLCLSSVGGQAQPPGYLGKRLFVKAHFMASRSIEGPTATKRDIDLNGKSVTNKRFGGQLGYALSRKHLLTFGIDRLSTGIEFQASTLSANAPTANGPFDYHDLYYRINGLTTSLGMRWFNATKGGLAPMGAYQGLSLELTFGKGKLLEQTTTFSGSAADGSRPLGIDPKHTYLAFAYEFGYNYVLFDRMLVGLAAQLSLPAPHGSNLGALFSTFPDTLRTDDYEQYNQEFFENKLTDRLIRHNLYSINLSIGWLIY